LKKLHYAGADTRRQARPGARAITQARTRRRVHVGNT